MELVLSTIKLKEKKHFQFSIIKLKIFSFAKANGIEDATSQQQ
jgi:hypothetical protein